MLSLSHLCFDFIIHVFCLFLGFAEKFTKQLVKEKEKACWTPSKDD